MSRFFTISFLLLLGLFPMNAQSQNLCNLTLTVSNIESTDGVLQIFIHQGPDGFPREKMYRVVIHPDVQKEKTTLIIPNIPYGSTAVSVLHDENKSGKMDFNWAHMPAEKFGFYRNYKVTLSAPKYEDVAFDINSETMDILIELQ